MHGDIGYKFCWLLLSEDQTQGTPARHVIIYIYLIINLYISDKSPKKQRINLNKWETKGTKNKLR